MMKLTRFKIVFRSWHHLTLYLHQEWFRSLNRLRIQSFTSRSSSLQICRPTRTIWPIRTFATSMSLYPSSALKLCHLKVRRQLSEAPPLFLSQWRVPQYKVPTMLRIMIMRQLQLDNQAKPMAIVRTKNVLALHRGIKILKHSKSKKTYLSFPFMKSMGNLVY